MVLRVIFALIFSSFPFYFSLSQEGDITAGLASWYGEKFHGKMTANGEIFDMMQFTAAHRTLPFGTKVKVVNLLNNKAVIVRINDRGPFKEDRIIDVSKAAAQELDFIKNGIIPVRLEVLVKGEVGKSSKEETIVPSFKQEQSHNDSLNHQSELNSSSGLEVSSKDESKESPEGKNSIQKENQVQDLLTKDMIADTNQRINRSTNEENTNAGYKEKVYVQVGSYKDIDNAINTARLLENVGFSIKMREGAGYYRVFFEEEREYLDKSLNMLEKQGYKEPLVRQTPVEGKDFDWKTDIPSS